MMKLMKGRNKPRTIQVNKTVRLPIFEKNVPRMVYTHSIANEWSRIISGPFRGSRWHLIQLALNVFEFTKVYDLVVLTNRDRNKVPISDECFAQIEACRDEGNTVTATCTEVLDTRRCDFVGAVPANIPDVPGAQIVILALHVHIRIQFFCNGVALPGCNFVVPVSFVDNVVLCFPEGTEINCNIFYVQCNVLLNQTLGNMVVIEIVMCKDVQVEAEVKLEVEAKFCGPREIIPIPELEENCPPLRFPQKCPAFFPTLNCECQGAAEFTGTATITYIGDGSVGAPTGELDLTTLVVINVRLQTAISKFVLLTHLDLLRLEI